MFAREFNNFRLVGGTALSLQRGHRQSADIDLFTDAEYGSVDFKKIQTFLSKTYQYVETNNCEPIGMGKSYYVGKNQNNCIKLDIYYTDAFIQDYLLIDNLRIASIDEIIAMKADVILRGGRKKDFWDIHEIIEAYSLEKIFALHKKRYPYTHDRKLLKIKFTDFETADSDFEPICLKGKYWEIIKLDIIDFVDG